MKQFTLAYYRDEVGQELLMFKNERAFAIERWLHYVDVNFDRIFKDMQIDYVLRALGSNEISGINKNTPLDLMGRLLAEKFNAKYIDNVLRKERTEQLKFAGDKYNRQKILNYTYTCNLKDLKQNARYLIIDDVSTTGTTFNEINRSLMEASNNTADTACFSLVQTLWNRDYTYEKQEFNSKFYKKLTA